MHSIFLDITLHYEQKQQQQHNFIEIIKLINYTVPQVAKASLGWTEERLRAMGKLLKFILLHK